MKEGGGGLCMMINRDMRPTHSKCECIRKVKYSLLGSRDTWILEIDICMYVHIHVCMVKFPKMNFP